MPRTPIETVLVLDAGTASGRASLVNGDGQIVAQASRPWQLPVAPDGSQDLPVDVMAAYLDDAVAEVLSAQAAPTVRAVASTSVRGSLVLLDAAGDVVWACGSSDARAHDEVQEMLPDELGFHAATGQKVTLAALPRLRWLARNRPSDADRVVRLLPLDGWLGQRYVGADVPASVSNASTTGLLGLRERTWSPLAASPWHRPGDQRFTEWLPGLAEAGETAGVVSATVARRTGLVGGIPVAVAGGDTQVGALALGCLAEGDSAVIMGSHWQSVVTLERPVADPEARYRVIAHALGDRWQGDAIAWSAGMFLDWFARAFSSSGGRRDGTRDEHERLGAEAGSLPPGARGVLAVGGLPLTRPVWAHASPSLLGFSLKEPKDARPAAYRAIAEAGCLAVSMNLDVIADGTATALPFDREIHVGGGASRSDLACQILADVTGRVIARSSTPQASTLGAAACAAVAAGWYEDTGVAARAMARLDSRFEPDARAHGSYLELAGRWRAAAAAQEALAKEGITTPVWKPAS